MKRCVCIIAIFAIVAGNLLVPAASDAHGIFKKHLEAKYTNDSSKLLVTCNACHVKGKPKTERTQLGQLFATEFEGMDLSKKWESYEDDLDAREKFELETMVPAFVEAYKKVGEMELKKGEGKIKDLFPSGGIDQTKVKEIKKK